MALTLPYPGMDFTPLDILTADEMDQLVANIEYIAQQFPIGSSNINWSSVAAANVAIGDFLSFSSGFSGTGNIAKFSNIVFGNLRVYSTNALTANQVIGFTVKSPYNPALTVNSFCGVSNSEWTITNPGYYNVSPNGTTYVADHTGSGNHWIKIQFVWRTA